MDIFNNREIATAIWLLVIFVFLLSKRDIRRSLFGVVKAFFQIRILTLVVLMMVYTTGIVILLNKVNLWETSLLKDSILWFFTGMVMAFKYIPSKADENFFREIIVDNLKVVVIITFLVNTYTFSLIGELILIPIITTIILFEAVAQTDEKFSPIAKLMRAFQIIIGSLILVYALSKAISDYRNLATLDTLRSFLLPILLSILFLPFMYFFKLFASYGKLFVWLNLGFEKSKKLKRYAKWEIIKHCRLSLEKIEKASNMSIYNLMQIKSEDDVTEMVRVYKQAV